MANPTVESSGTQSATVATEHSLDTINVAGTFQLSVDIGPLADGDVLELRAYRKLLASGTDRCIALGIFYGAQMTDFRNADSLFVANVQTSDADAIEFTLKQTFGTGRSFPWTVFKWT